MTSALPVQATKSTHRRKSLWKALKFCLALLAAGAIFWWRSQPKRVQTTHPTYRIVVESIAASGRVRGSVESEIGANGGGRVADVFVRQGSRVARGKLLARLDDSILRSQVLQAQAAVATARAELARAARPPLPSEIARLRADVKQAEDSAMAKLLAARLRLTELIAGPTREEKAQAAAALSGAQTRLAQATRETERQQQLFDEGVPRSESEAAESAVRLSEEALAQTEAQLDLAKRDALRQQQLYGTNARAELDRAQTAARVAQETLAKTQADLTLARKEKERQRQLFEGGATPRADLERAEASLQTAQAALDSATAQRDQAKLDLDRQRAIYNEGSVPLSEVERTRTAVQVAERAVAQTREKGAQAKRDLERVRKTYGATGRAALENAQFAQSTAETEVQGSAEKLRQLQVGTRPEQIAQARAEIQAAQAAVQGARQSGAAQLQTLLAQPRREEINAAQARVLDAQNALRVAQQRLDDVLVRAPFGGVVTEILTEIGGVTGPGQPILRLVRAGVPEIRVDVDENNLGRLTIGQKAIITSDAFRGRRFQARVRQIGSEVNAQRGTIEVRLDPLSPPTWLRPGQTLNVNIIVDAGSRRLTVPLTAVKSAANISVVMLLKNGTAVQKTVVTGASGPDGVPIVSGLTRDDLVIVGPPGVIEGQKVAAQ